MSIGENIRRAREARGLTQQNVADEMETSFQSVSNWERDVDRPEFDKLLKLLEILNVEPRVILTKNRPEFKTRDQFFDVEHMKTFVKAGCRTENTMKAVEFAFDKHQGVTRKNTTVPYIYHPLILACHALALGVTDDAIISACMLHDVVEDCNVSATELPVDEETREIVSLLTKPEDMKDDNRSQKLKLYYDKIGSNPKAAFIKCLDRCNNLSTLSWGLKKERQYRMIKETEEYYPRLLKVLKNTTEFNNAAWLLKYQMETILDIYKRVL